MAPLHKCGKNNGIHSDNTVYEMEKIEISSSDDEKETNGEGRLAKCNGHY